MNYKICTIPRFDKDVKKLKKRFPKIKDDLLQLIQEFKNNPTIGTHLTNNIYKIRLQNSSISSGKSGGFRVIAYYLINECLYLISIYSKTDKENISNNDLINIIEKEVLSKD